MTQRSSRRTQDAPPTASHAAEGALPGTSPDAYRVGAAGVPPVLRLRPAGDAYEREADRLARYRVEGGAGPPQRPVLRVLPQGGAPLDPGVAGAIRAAQEGGTPLPAAVRAPLEARLGTDLRGMRVHTGAEAHRLNLRLDARAFTVGRDVFFREGQYRPDASEGQALLAHEAAHVVQQQSAGAEGAAGEVVQRSSWLGHHSNRLATPAKVLADTFGYAKNQFNIAQARNQAYLQDYVERPDWVEAEVKGARNVGRPPSSVPAMVASLGNSELQILNGFTQNYYEGGHLIGDAYLGNLDSMEEWNLAPQHDRFNAPTYYNEVERLIEALPIDVLSGTGMSSVPIKVRAEVKYHDDAYTVTEKELKDHLVLPLFHPYPQPTDNGGKGKVVTIPRRVPRYWGLKATIDPTSHPNVQFAEKDITPSTIKDKLIQSPLSTDFEPYGSYHINSPNFITSLSTNRAAVAPGQSLTFTAQQFFPTNQALKYQAGGTTTPALPKPPPSTRFGKKKIKIKKVFRKSHQPKYKRQLDRIGKKYSGHIRAAILREIKATGLIPSTRSELSTFLLRSRNLPKGKTKAKNTYRLNVRYFIQDANLLGLK